MKPPVVDDRSQFVEVIQKKSTSSSTDDDRNNNNEASAASKSSPLSMSSLEEEMNKMWNSAIGATTTTTTAPPTEPALLEHENEEQQQQQQQKGAVEFDKSHVHQDNNDMNTNHEEKKDDVLENMFSFFRSAPAAAAPTTVTASRDDDEVLEEGLEAMWVEEIVSATPKAAEGVAEAAVTSASHHQQQPAAPLAPLSTTTNNNYNTHTGRLRKSFFGKKKRFSGGSGSDNNNNHAQQVVVIQEEDAVGLLQALATSTKVFHDNHNNINNKPTKVQTSIRLLENEPELQLPHHVVSTNSARVAAAAAAATAENAKHTDNNNSKTTTTITPATEGMAPATTPLQTPISRKTIFSTGTSIDTDLLKEAALKAFTARKLLAQALSMSDHKHHNSSAGGAAAAHGGGSREALAQSAFREATHARKMVESGNAKGEGTLPKGLDVILREATDKGAEAVAMMQQQLRNAAACKNNSDNNTNGDDLLPARSIEEHADRARHYLDLILPDAPGMTQAQARSAAAAAAASGTGARGDEVSSLGMDNTVSFVSEADDGAGGDDDNHMNLLSMSSLNEILDGPIDPDSPAAALSSATKSSPTIQEQENKDGDAAADGPPVLSNTSKNKKDSPDRTIVADAAAAVPSNKSSKKLAQPDEAVPSVNNKEKAIQQPTDAAVQPDIHKTDKKRKKKKERKSKSLKKSGFFGRFRAAAACQAPNLSSSSSSGQATTETQDKAKKARAARKAARDAKRSNRFLASITIDDGQEDDDEPVEPEVLSKAHHRIKDVDDRMLKKLHDAIQADCDESVTSFDGIKMHGAPVLEVAKNDNKDKKKPKDNKSKNGVEKIAPVVEEPAPKHSRSIGTRQTTFISAPAGTPAILTQASWDSLFQQNAIKQEAAPDVSVPSSSEGTSNQDHEEEEEDVTPVSSSSASSSQRMDPPQLNQEQQDLRNIVSKSPDSTMSHGDKYSVDQEETMEQTTEDEDNMAVVENTEPKEDRYLVLPADFNTFEAFLHSCGSEMDTLCGVGSKTEDATRQVLLQDLPSSAELPPDNDNVVPSPEGLAVERGVAEKMTVETSDPTTLSKESGEHNNNTNRMKNILSRLSTKRSHELNTTKSLLSSKSSRSKNGQGSSRKGLLGFFNNMGSSSKKEVLHSNTAKTPNMDSDVDRQLLPPTKADEAPVVTPEVPSKEAEMSISAESLSNDQDMDKQLSLPLTNELGTSSESTTNELPPMDKYSNAIDDGPKMEAKATTETTLGKPKSGTLASMETLDKPHLEAPDKAAKVKALPHKEKLGETKVATPKKEAIAKEFSSKEKRNPKKESKAKGLLQKPTRVTPKKAAKESNKGTPKKEVKEKNKKQKPETRNTKAKAKKQPLASTKEESKLKAQVLVVEKKRGETPKESNDGTPFQNSSNKAPDDKTNAIEQSLAASTSQAGPQVASTETVGAIETPTQLPPKKIPANNKSKKTPVPTSTEVPKINSDTENKEDPLITLIREQSFRQSQKSRDPVSVDETDPPRGIDP